MKKLIPIVLVVLVVCALAANFLLSAAPSLKLDPSVKALGMDSPVRVDITSPHGVRRVTAWVEQGGKRHQVFEKTEPSRRLSWFRDSEPVRQVAFTAGRKQAPELKDGPAKLIVETVANDFAGRSATASADIQVNTTPPTVSADGLQHYINQGGSELVTFTVGGYWTEAGVRVGKYMFRSFPLPGGKGETDRFSLFAFPWDVPADTVPAVYARNPSGAEATARFSAKVFPKQFRSRELNLDDKFLTKVAQELDPNGSGSLIDRFLKINGQMRKENNQTLAELRFKTEPKVLWNGPFYRLGKVESFFADQRTYLYNGKKVDQQMHLGFDLSDVQASPVRAANSGKVIHAGPLGIYGNCIVVDHGYGLQSIYGHMRQIDVKVGDSVQKEQVMGKSGDTGLAGGDHVHFSLQVDGIQVNPIEWWDPHWIQDRILSKLPAAK
jgi:murein DD-endopeptidase MepM/ murein hydrolase activator NlpD